jgi:hypothetical protein
MYFCIQCKRAHEETSLAKVFSTGFIFINNKMVPLGTCEGKRRESADNQTSSKNKDTIL